MWLLKYRHECKAGDAKFGVLTSGEMPQRVLNRIIHAPVK